MAVKSNFASGEILTASDVNTYLTNGGLVYVASNTATSGSTINVTSCFSSTYDAYKVVVSNCVTSGSVDVNIRCLVGTTVNASNWTYATIRADYGAGTIGMVKATGSAGVNLAIASTTNPISFEFFIAQPNMAKYTSVQCIGGDPRSTSGYFAITTSGQLENNTQYDGLQISVGAQTFSSIKAVVYGYRQA